MAAQGRGPDRTLVHMSPREVQGLQALAMAHGGSLTINPETGLPEAGFLENMLPAIAGFALNAFAPGVGTAVGSLFGLGGAAGTALTVGGIAGLTSGSLEKGIMAGMGAYGGAGLGASLQNSGTSALTQAGVDAAGGAAALGGDASAIQDTVAKASAFDKIKAGVGAAFSQPKDFLQDNKMNLALLTAPALMGTFDDKTVLPAAQATKKYNMNYVRDPVTGALYDTSGEGVTYGGVGRPTIGMADGGSVPNYMTDAGTIGYVDPYNPKNLKPVDPYDAVKPDTRSDSEKSYDYLMGVPGAKNPMLFTHESTSAIKPADMLTRKGGHYVLDAATNRYVWVPDDTTAADAAAALAAKEGLAALDRRGGGNDGLSSNPGWDAMTQNEKAAYYAAHPLQAKLENAFLGIFGKQNPNHVFVEDRAPVPVSVSNAAAAGLAALSENSQQAADNYSANAQNAVNTNSNVTDPAQMMQAREAAQVDTFGNSVSDNNDSVGRSVDTFGNSVSDNNDSVGRSVDAADANGPSDGPSGDGPSGDGGDGGDGDGDAKGGFYKNGKFNFHPAQVYANGGIAALAGGGLGSLGGYSDGGQLLRGPGNGTSDDIPARIGRNQPARLADGEFVVPARIVSELGNGSTDAGARELYKMMARIQAGRAKTVGKNKVAVNSKSARHLPA